MAAIIFEPIFNEHPQMHFSNSGIRAPGIFSVTFKLIFKIKLNTRFIKKVVQVLFLKSHIDNGLIKYAN